MAFTLAFHILLVPLGVALRRRSRSSRTGAACEARRRRALLLARRWSKVMAVTFAVGAVTGTVLSFEFGLLWPGFMGKFGSVFGAPVRGWRRSVLLPRGDPHRHLHLRLGAAEPAAPLLDGRADPVRVGPGRDQHPGRELVAEHTAGLHAFVERAAEERRRRQGDVQPALSRGRRRTSSSPPTSGRASRRLGVRGRHAARPQRPLPPPRAS